MPALDQPACVWAPTPLRRADALVCHVNPSGQPPRAGGLAGPPAASVTIDREPDATLDPARCQERHAHAIDRRDQDGGDPPGTRSATRAHTPCHATTSACADVVQDRGVIPARRTSVGRGPRRSTADDALGESRSVDRGRREELSPGAPVTSGQHRRRAWQCQGARVRLSCLVDGIAVPNARKRRLARGAPRAQFV